MDPQLSGFALGLLFGAAKVGFIGTIGFAIAWWRARKKLAVLEATLPDPGLVEQRLASLEQAADYSASQLDRLLEGQVGLLRGLGSPGLIAPPAERAEHPAQERNTPH